MKRARIKKCPVCYGEVAVYGGHAVDELRGGSYQRWLPCPNPACDDGWVEDPDTVSVGPLLYAAAAVVIVVMALMAGLHQSAPRSSPDPTASPSLPASGLSGDLSRSGASGLGSSGAPSVAAGAPLPAGGLVSAEHDGVATWYDDGPGIYAAAGPELRNGAWRGSTVDVCGKACIPVRLSDWCACGDRAGLPTLLDLSADAFARVAGCRPGTEEYSACRTRALGAGVMDVSVRTHVGPIRLPATDAAP